MLPKFHHEKATPRLQLLKIWSKEDTHHPKSEVSYSGRFDLSLFNLQQGEINKKKEIWFTEAVTQWES